MSGILGHRGLLMAGEAAPAGDPYWANVVSLLHFDGANGSATFTDEKGRSWGRFGSPAPVISTAQSKFGGSSLLANTSDSTIQVGIETNPSADFQFGIDDFTVEWWQYWVRFHVPSYQAAFQCGYGTTGAITLVTGNADGRYALALGAETLVCKEASAGTTGTWTHYAVTRSGTNFQIWRNGTASASGTSALGAGATGKKFAIGCYASDSGALGQVFNGYIDDFRVTKGVARYTSNFTPPTAPFPDF